MKPNQSLQIELKTTMDNFKIDGMTELLQALDDLDSKIKDDLFRNANTIILKDVVKGDLEKQVNTVRTSTNKKGKVKNVSPVIVYNDRKDKSAVKIGVSTDYFWLRFIEYGTKLRFTRKKKVNRGQLAARNRIINTIKNLTDPILKKVENDYGKIINDVLEKKIKKINK
jgi:hypothetical protein